MRGCDNRSHTFWPGRLQLWGILAPRAIPATPKKPRGTKRGPPGMLPIKSGQTPQTSSHQPRGREGQLLSGLCRAAFLQLSFLLRDPLELEILLPAASG